jgi:hypothetical protein
MAAEDSKRLELGRDTHYRTMHCHVVFVFVQAVPLPSAATAESHNANIAHHHPYCPTFFTLSSARLVSDLFLSI